ncbi:MAG TPA: RIP metalloprotease RseP [Terriglobales bacterium]|jgi:regulator of sigma E protease|nr:RIP metalloprotease RseP [Terriglobales bacterium]
MYNILTNIAAVAVVLGVMITIHELGHFLAAKYFKVRVEQFAIGFGKRLIGFRRGETDYRINLLPLGGYVKMSGENPMEPKTGDPGEFTSHPRWQRFVIALAGPSMNIMLAIVLLTGVFMVRYEHPVYLEKPAVIGWVLEGSAAATSDIRPGDRIVRIENVQDPTWEDVLPKVVLSPGRPVNLAIQREGQILSKTIVPTPTGPEQFGSPGWLPDQPNVITQLERGMPADKAGIHVGDIVVAINGEIARSMPAVSRYIQSNKTKPVEITLVRDGHEIKITATPEEIKEGADSVVYRLGMRSDPVEVEHLPLGRALAKSFDQNKKNSLLILELVQKMVKREVSMRQIDGPIRIAQVSGEAARQEGWTPLLGLMAAISLNLGIFNLFPFPILDGGVILLLLIEGVRQRDISTKVKEKIYQFAFVLLILFAVAVIYNDLVKTIPGVMQRLP